MIANNNFNLLRLIGAVLVLYGHSFVFLKRPEPIVLNWLPYGPLGVYIFFTISGYLIVKSWNSDPVWYRFLLRRALRIFPALFVCILATFFILGPLTTSLSLREYFTNPIAYLYLLNVFLFPVYSLPGVFANNAFPNAVNGSLWSLPIEFALYLCILLGGVAFGRWKPIYACVVALILIVLSPLWAWQPGISPVFYVIDVKQFVVCGAYFFVGAALHSIKMERNLISSLTLLAIFGLMLLQPWLQTLRVAGFFLIPVAALSFALTPSIRVLDRILPGDYSYGIYIYAFPTQQTIAYLFPGMVTGWYILLAFILTLVPSVASWHLLEKKALSLKPRKRQFSNITP